ncbi:DsrE/DsrF/DrsH-like family protein [Clostridia bacterium]|nr:DsrE/DsrF/DrsH-like family protein [Clostridia bacterium]
MGRKILIVGGVAGGAGTAARLRRMDEEAEIIVFERGSYISFANCGLPYYVGGTIKNRRDLLLQTPEAMMARFNIEIRINNEVTRIDRQEKEIEVKGENGFYKESYDVLVLSPGSTPLVPPIPGIANPNIFSLWTVPDVDKIKSYVEDKNPRTAIVIGGGFIGIEMAENLYDLGIEVSIVEMLDQVMTPFDYDMAQILHENITSKGVNLELSNGVKSFDYQDGTTKVTLQDGKEISADMVILSIGIRPNGELAKAAGLEVNKRGGIVVDDYLKTSDDSIYALGDVIEVKHYIGREETMIPLAGPANRQARILANNICGAKEAYRGSQGTSVAKVFDLTAASTGYNEKALKAKGLEKKKDFDSVITILRSHAGYYPAALPLTLKVIYDMEGKILGAQGVGYDGVDKRIDVIATAIRFKGTIDDLKDLELAYAPPYSSAKDPVNMAGFVADNVLTGRMGSIDWDEIATLDPKTTQLLDVREAEERELGKIDPSIHIPINSLRKRIGELDKDKEVIIYCAVGIRGYIGARILMQKGFKVRNLLGGYTHYRRAIKDYSLKDVLGIQNAMSYGDQIKQNVESKAVIKVDACGMQCPGPIMEVNKKMQELRPGEVLEVMATDPGFPSDAKAWSIKTGNRFLHEERTPEGFKVSIAKGGEVAKSQGTVSGDNGTMVVFSGDLDKAIAAFIIANGAAAMGKQMTLFFTFWGLNILRKDSKISLKKSPIERMFGMMMPRGAKKLTLSKMNMGGMGTKMMQKVMKDKNVTSLEDLVNSALESGVKIVACTMSMDIMGLQKEELIDGIEYAGVASYLGETDAANFNLFV